MIKEFVICVDGHIIYSKAFGTWNETIYRSFEQAMNDALKEVKKPYVEVLDLRKWKIGTLDMINLAVERHRKATEAGRLLHVTIAKKESMSYLIAYNHIYKRTDGYRHEGFYQFEEVSACCQFLEEQGYHSVSIKQFITEIENMSYEDNDLFQPE